MHRARLRTISLGMSARVGCHRFLLQVTGCDVLSMSVRDARLRTGPSARNGQARPAYHEPDDVWC
jgi:hypothetical protein